MICSIVEAKNLGHSASIKDDKEIVIEPYVRITTEVHEPGKLPVMHGDPISTSTAQPTVQTQDKAKAMRQMATWRSKEDPTGQTINLGRFTRIIQDDPIDLASGFGAGSFVLGIEKMQEGPVAFDDEEDRVEMDLSDSKDVFLRFEVFHGDKLLGQMVQQAVNFISLKNSIQSKQVLLLLPKE